jgi:hypothetical protein
MERTATRRVDLPLVTKSYKLSSWKILCETCIADVDIAACVLEEKRDVEKGHWCRCRPCAERL